MNSIPVIFFHDGNQKYLKYAIDSAKAFNKYVFLIGTNNNQDFCEDWFNLELLNGEKYRNFVKMYQHMSTNSYEFELACFRRYFMLEEFMTSKNFDECIMIDSDVLTYCDYSKLHCFENVDVSVTIVPYQGKYDWAASPHIFYCKREALSKYITFILDTYQYHIHILKEKADYFIKNHLKGGICDMTLLYLWSVKNEVRFTNLIQADDICFDNCVQSANHLRPNQFKINPLLRIKKIKKKGNNIFFLEQCTKKLIPVGAIHFQGSAKSIMCDVYDDNNLFLKILHRYNDILIRIVKKLLG